MTHLRRADWEVRKVDRSVAVALVRQYHYAGGGPNTGVYFHGLFRKGGDECLGVAWWLPPTRGAAEATARVGTDWRRVLSLTRLVVAPEVPTNGASFLLGGSVRTIRAVGAWDCLVTYADTWRGHTGAIYRADNWEYVGLTKPSPVWLDAEGRMVARKRGPSNLSVAEMLDCGYVCAGSFAKHKYRKSLDR